MRRQIDFKGLAVFQSYRQYYVSYAVPLQASLDGKSGLVMEQPMVEFLEAERKQYLSSDQ